MPIDSTALQERLNDVLFFIGVNFWYLFLLAALLFFLLAVKSFKDKIEQELQLGHLNKWLLYLSKLDRLGEIEDHLLNFKTYINGDGTALYIRRGETFILQAQSMVEEAPCLPRLHMKEIEEYRRIGKRHYYYIISEKGLSLYIIASKGELEIEDYEGFIKVGLAYYEKSQNVSQEHNLSTISTASKEVLSKMMKIHYTADMFLKFIVSLLIKSLNAKGIVLKNRNRPKKAIYFKEPESSTLQKSFYIRNTPYILELYRDKPLSPKEIAEVGSFLDLAGAYFESNNENSRMVQNYIKFLRFSVRAIELQSPYFKNHSKKVEITATEIAKALFLSDREIKQIALGAYLHDIGMIGKIENFIDSKKIGKEDLQLIRYHPIVGAVLVEPISHVYNLVPIIKYHHERYDGEGYPFGLRGKDIPLNAQIVALAEYYIGITSPRAYRKAMDHGEAMEDIERQRDQLVEAGIIDAFIESADTIQKKLRLLEEGVEVES
ncbi:MAG: HD domain-containing protein [Epsilonproteobacteria bacterium]|nr:hypothetical protein [Campylobacterota bacterium]NPA57602.1 HD domain-containing protein [Campylobacterota bacterium]